jgi:hypothetical protein
MMQAMQNRGRARLLSPAEHLQQFSVLAQRADGSAFDAQIRNHANAVGDARRREIPHDTIELPSRRKRRHVLQPQHGLGACRQRMRGEELRNGVTSRQHRAAPCHVARIE